MLQIDGYQQFDEEESPQAVEPAPVVAAVELAGGKTGLEFELHTYALY